MVMTNIRIAIDVMAGPTETTTTEIKPIIKEAKAICIPGAS